MLPKKVSAWFWTALILLSSCWHTIPAHAQERLLLYEPVIAQPPPPVLGNFFPHNGQLDTELVLTLEGEGFFELGELLIVNIGNLEIPVLDYQIGSESRLEIAIYLPNETPIGEQTITIFFENAGFEDTFTVRAREAELPEQAFPLLNLVTPREGDVDTDIELRLDGESLFDLGELISVNINGFEIPVYYSESDSAESMQIGIYLPADTPPGERIISFVFGNAGFETPFRVIAPPSPRIPPAIIVAVVVAVVGLAGAGGWLALRARKSRTDQLREKSGKHLPQIDFIVAIDPGTQSVEFAEQSLALDIDLRFELEVDQGEQEIEPDGASIVIQE
ncbi:MAG TPA: hypothetical protein VLA49_22090 [Anaerolineales bacterium]|nr:hypothetical protein [Anaerolineales bacterium]